LESWHAARVRAIELADGELRAQGFSTWIPLAAAIIVERGKIARIMRPLFGPYIFVRFDPEDGRWRSINGTRGVIRLLPERAERPQSILAGSIESLMARAAAGDFDAPAALDAMMGYLPGDWIDVRRGPLGGHAGELIGTARGRLTLLMALLGRRTVVSIEPASIDPAPSRAGVR
jgi:transcriptional antiterminator RfaH